MKQKLDKKTLNNNRIQAIQKSIIESNQTVKSINLANKIIQEKKFDEHHSRPSLQNRENTDRI